MINNKELYCLYRARELNESLGMTLRQGWDQAEREWRRGECVPLMFWDGQFRDSVHLYGHVHNSQQWNIAENFYAETRALQALPMRAYNVGVMMSYMDYGPRTLTEIIDANMLVVKDH